MGRALRDLSRKSARRAQTEWRKMRRSLAPMIVLTLIGLLFGATFRYFLDVPSEGTVANYLRSALHGAGLTLAGWAIHLYFASRRSEWVRRWPLAVELIVRSVVMAIVVGTLAIALEVVLYDHRIETAWMVGHFPSIVGVTFLMSILVGAVYELTRLIGGRVLFNVLIGRYRRTIREQRIYCCSSTWSDRPHWRNGWGVARPGPAHPLFLRH
jgi:hypothetical protein